jgi:hypothetical protein
MVVHKPLKDDPSYPLKQWDVITKIGDTPVDDQGMIKVGEDLRVRFEYEIQHVATNGAVPLTLLREGKELQVSLPLQTHYQRLIPSWNGAYSSYFIYGPLVFSAATQEYFDGFLRTKYASRVTSRMGASGNPLLTRMADAPSFPGEGLVVIASPFFPHKLAQGYSDPRGEVVKSINGIHVKNLSHLVEILRDTKEQFIRVECETRFGETMVFPRAKMLAATDDILSDNGIRSQGSPDTMAVWKAKSAVQ